MVVTVLDSGRSGNSSCSVTVTSSAGDSETLSLAALGGGAFQGSIVTAAGAAVPGDGILEVGSGGTITASYTDANSGVATAQATVTVPLQITTASTLPVAVATRPYSVTLAAAGGLGRYTWAAVGNYTESNPGTGWLGNE